MTIYLIFIDNLLKILQNFQQIPLEFLQIFHRNFMYRLYMFCEIILITNIIFTLVTFIPHPFMYSLYMFGEIIQITNIIFTLVTYIPQLFMYSLYMFGEIILITNIIFTLVTPSKLSHFIIQNEKNNFFLQNVTFDMFKSTQNFLTIFPV